MSFGPELIWIWSKELERCRGRRAQRVDGGNNSVVISFGAASDMLLSWGAQNCGAALISQKEKKSFLSSVSQTPPITNALRSHLTGAELSLVEQLRRDRILKLTFTKTVGAGFSVTRCLIIEIMERFSNILLVDEDGNIIETAKHIHPADNSYRTVLPGLPYHLPPAFDGTSLEEWLASPDKSSIQKIAGFGKPLLKLLSGAELDKAVSILGSFYGGKSPSGFVPQKIGRYVTSLPELLPEAEALEDEDTGRMIALAPLRDAAFESRRKHAVRLIEKEITRRERQAEDIERLLSDDRSGLYRQYGELIVANLWQVRHNVEETELNGYDDSGKEISLKVPLDPRLSPSQNAARYFAKYKKITAAQERASALLATVKEELDDQREALALAWSISDAESLLMLEEELGTAKVPAQKRGAKKKSPPLPPHRRFEFDRALVFAGLSSKGNRYVTFKLALPDDLWFHAQGVPGSHVILRPLSTLAEDELNAFKDFCASLAAYYSKARESSRQRVDYTRRRYVSPIRGGEANVTYKEFSTVAGDPLLWQRWKELNSLPESGQTAP
ncbi:Rqc2 family fibronectin-binding protein [Cloacibacillus evryensis]|uniref:Rqc2 family fibronectin-binding protein n=1 Tax=Cloacibacillus evryensis TaxID=508460 RepID=UPI0004B215B3|nr:NFACT family protein [Cloacibacillus evryensis]MEA5033949.1 NFACT family protein [Cloacibacillus evryensis]